MRKLYLMLLGLLFFAGQAIAQRTISGTVRDDKGNPLPNVSVVVKGTTTGTTTKVDGTYSLVLPANARTLVFSSIDMATQEVNVSTSSDVSVTLTQQGKNMDEVIVVAYGTVKKGDFTGSANQANYDDFKNRPILNPLNAIVATGPGLQTTQAGGAPGSSPGIAIRGFGSINAATGPLIVLDGVPYNGGLANLNTEDIESITTLKDAATTALWGSRASNGVIMITSKKGKRNKNSVNFRVLQGFSRRGLEEYDRVGPYDYYPLMWEGMKNSLQYGSGQAPATAAQNATNGIKTQLGYNPFNVPNNQIVGTDGKLNPAAQLLWADDLDWNRELERTGSRQEYALSYSGGNDKSDYFGSFSFINEKGFIIRSDWRRFSGRLNVNAQPLNWFKTGINISASVNNSNQASDGSNTGYVNPFFFTRSIGSIYPVYARNQTTGALLLNALGQPFYDYGNLSALGIPNRPGGASPGRHILEETKLNQSSFKRNTMSGRGYVTLNFTPALKFTTNLAVDITDYNAMTYENTKVGDGAPAGRASATNQKIVSYTFNQLAEYAKKFKAHNFSALIGHENYDLQVNNFNASRQGQIIEGIYEISNFSVINSAGSSEDNHNIESWFSRLNYDFDGKYFLSANLRRDGNARFSPDVRWATFWGAGGAWRVDREKFMSNVGWVNALKLRGSYGELGNDAISTYYAYQDFYFFGPARNNNTEPGATINQLANPMLTWESSVTWDAAIEFGLFRDRIRGHVEYYNRNSERLIFDVQLPPSLGGFNIPTNIGSMYNRGFEIEIGGDPIRKKDIVWNIKLNATTLQNKITKMPPSNKEIISGTKKLAEGRSVYDFWLREWYGVDPSDGAALYRANVYNAANSRLIDDGKGGKDTVTTDINNARFHYNGSSIPDLFGGIENTITYKGFEFSFLLQYQLGGKVYDGAYASLMHVGTYGSALHIDALNRWTKPGDITNVPRLDNSRTGIFDAASDRWLIDASFLAVRSINLSYQLPKSLMNRMQAQSGSFFIGAENVALFSKRKGMNVNQNFAGTTGNVYSLARIITAGITVNF